MKQGRQTKKGGERREGRGGREEAKEERTG